MCTRPLLHHAFHLLVPPCMLPPPLAPSPGDMFVWSNQYGQIINPLTGKTVLTLPNWRTSGPKVKGMNTAYPFGGTAVMLPLTYKNDYKVVEIM